MGDSSVLPDGQKSFFMSKSYFKEKRMQEKKKADLKSENIDLGFSRHKPSKTLDDIDEGHSRADSMKSCYSRRSAYSYVARRNQVDDDKISGKSIGHLRFYNTREIFGDKKSVNIIESHLTINTA